MYLTILFSILVTIMGFSGIISTMIMFIAVVSLALTVIGAFKTISDDTSSSMLIQSNTIKNTMRTDITIENIDYDNVTDITTINVRNTGSTVLDIDQVDVYLDGLFTPRNVSNRTIEVISSTEVKNPGLWDPNELIQIEVFKALATGDYGVAVSTQYSVKDETIFSLEDG